MPGETIHGFNQGPLNLLLFHFKPITFYFTLFQLFILESDCLFEVIAFLLVGPESLLEVGLVQVGLVLALGEFVFERGDCALEVGYRRGIEGIVVIGVNIIGVIVIPHHASLLPLFTTYTYYTIISPS